MSLKVKVQGDTKDVEKAIKGLGDKFDNLSQKVSNISSLLILQASHIVSSIGNATQAVIGLSQEMSDSTEEARRWSHTLGVTTDELSGIAEATRDAKIEQEDLFQVMADLSERAIENQGDYKRMGIAIRDASGNMKTSSELFYSVIQRISEVKTTSDKMSIALGLAGDQGAKLVAVANQGAEALREQAQAFENSVYAITQYQAELNNLSVRSIDGINRVSSALVRQVNEVIQPWIIGFRRALANVLDDLAVWFQRNKDLIQSGIAEWVQWMATVGLPGMAVAINTINDTWFTMTRGFQSVRVIIGDILAWTAGATANMNRMAIAARKAMGLATDQHEKDLQDALVYRNRVINATNDLIAAEENRRVAHEKTNDTINRMFIAGADLLKQTITEMTAVRREASKAARDAVQDFMELKGNVNSVAGDLDEAAAKAARLKKELEAKKAAAALKAAYQEAFQQIKWEMEQAAVIAQNIGNTIGSSIAAGFEDPKQAVRAFAQGMVNTLNQALNAYVQQWIQSQIAIAAAEKARMVTNYPMEASMVAVKGAQSVAATPFIGPALAVAVFTSLLGSMLTMAIGGFASGGIVSGSKRDPKSDNVLAMLTPGELVIPKSQTESLLHAASNRGTNMVASSPGVGLRGGSEDRGDQKLILNIVGASTPLDSSRLASVIDQAIRRAKTNNSIQSGRRVF